MAVSQKVAEADSHKDKVRCGDVDNTAVGVVLFWAVLLFNGGNGAKASSIAHEIKTPHL